MGKTVEHDGKKVAIEATIRSFGLARFVSIDWGRLQTQVKEDPRIVVEIAKKLGTTIVYQDGSKSTD